MQLAPNPSDTNQGRVVASYRFSVRSGSPSPDAKLRAYREGRMPRATVSIRPLDSIDPADRDGALAARVAHTIGDLAAGAGIRVHDIVCRPGAGSPRPFTVCIHGNAPAFRYAQLERLARTRLAANGTAGLDLRIVGR